jgi:hypothetical protein
MGEVHGEGIPKQAQLQDGDLFSLRRPGHGSVTHLKPGRAHSFSDVDFSTVLWLR